MDASIKSRSPSSHKRTLPEDSNFERSSKAVKLDFNTKSNPISPQSVDSTASSSDFKLQSGQSRHASPASSLLSSLSDVSSRLPYLTHDTANDMSKSTAPAAKRRKLTPIEKEQKRLEKEHRQKEQAVQKAKREEEMIAKKEERNRREEIKEEQKVLKDLEKIKREQEKRRKEEERDKQKRQRETEKQEKEEEKRRKEEEKEKKERAQTRLNNFFTKPDTTSKPRTVYPDAVNEREDAKSDISPNTVQQSVVEMDTDTPVTQSDYERTFLPFHVGANTTCAPYNNFSRERNATFRLEPETTKTVSAEQLSARKVDIKELFYPSPDQEGSQSCTYTSVKTLIAQISTNETMYQPVDLIGEGPDLNPLVRLRKIPMKYIYFHQDVRPPYVGTYSRLSQSELSCVARQPFHRFRPDTIYEYDSEAEWEEPEDGEDLESEGDSEDDPDEEDMTEFLDDEGALNVNISKKRLISGDLEPVSSGLCWENPQGRITVEPAVSTLRGPLRMEFLHDMITLPIDPFSTKYWTLDDVQMKVDVPNVEEAARSPLQAHMNTSQNGFMMNTQPGKPLKGKAAKSLTEQRKVLSGDDLEKFKTAVNGNDLPKVALLAILKKRFPKFQNVVLKDTLNAVAMRVGKTEVEKRWVIADAVNPSG